MKRGILLGVVLALLAPSHVPMGASGTSTDELAPMEQVDQELVQEVSLTETATVESPGSSTVAIGIDEPLFHAPFNFGREGTNVGEFVLCSFVCMTWISSASATASDTRPDLGQGHNTAATAEIALPSNPVDLTYDEAMGAILDMLASFKATDAHAWSAVGHSYDSVAGCGEQQHPVPARVRFSYRTHGKLDNSATGAASAASAISIRAVPHTFLPNPMDAAPSSSLVFADAHYMNGVTGDTGGHGTRKLVESGAREVAFLQDISPGQGTSYVTQGVITHGATLVAGEALSGADFYGEERLELQEIRIDWVDSTAPLLHYELDGVVGKNGWFRSAVNVDVHAADPQTCVDRIAYKVGSDSWQILDVDPWSPFIRFQVPVDGVHHVQFKALNHEGQWSEPQTVDLKIDTTAPDVRLTRPSHGHCYADTSVAAVELPGVPGQVCAVGMRLELWASASDGVSGVEEVTFSVDEAEIARDEAYPYSGDWVFRSVPPTVGSASVSTCAEDRAGNRECGDAVTVVVVEARPSFLGNQEPVCVQGIILVPGCAVAIDPFNDAHSCQSVSCVAASGTGTAYGGVAVSATGDTHGGDGTQWSHIAVAPLGTATGTLVAVAGDGDATGGRLAVSGTGNASSPSGVALAPLGSADGIVPVGSSCSPRCVDLQTEDEAEAEHVAVSLHNTSRAPVAASGTGASEATILAASATNSATGPMAASGEGPSRGGAAALSAHGDSEATGYMSVGVSGTGFAYGDLLGVSGTGDSRSRYVAVSGTGDAESSGVAVDRYIV